MLLIRPVLKMHNLCYKLAGVLSSSINSGDHPKHKIMQYDEWFKDNINSGDVVLDIGCNTGTMTHSMSKKASYVYAIDINCRYIQVARKNNMSNNISYICSDATTYDYSQCKLIQMVTLSNVLEHIEYRVDFLKKLINQIPWANNSKTLLIRVPMLDREWISVYKKEIGVEYRLDNTHFIEYTYESFKKEMDEAKIDILSHHVKFGEIYAICQAVNY
jgi:predicted RNA methylase